jgi:hypothetical protein
MKEENNSLLYILIVAILAYFWMNTPINNDVQASGASKFLAAPVPQSVPPTSPDANNYYPIQVVPITNPSGGKGNLVVVDDKSRHEIVIHPEQCPPRESPDFAAKCPGPVITAQPPVIEPCRSDACR